MNVDTPKYGHAPIKMVPRANRDFWEGDWGVAGEFYWEDHDGKRVLYVLLPFHNGKAKFVNIPAEITIGHANESGAAWKWDGNEDCPTLTPSIHTHGVWHGFVTDGFLVEA